MEAEEKVKKTPIVPVLREMAEGERVEFAVEMLASVKTCCSSYGLMWDRTFKTSVNRERRVVVVERLR